MLLINDWKEGRVVSSSFKILKQNRCHVGSRYVLVGRAYNVT